MKKSSKSPISDLKQAQDFTNPTHLVTRRPHAVALEPRFMFDAAAAATGAEVLADQAAAAQATAALEGPGTNSTHPAQAPAANGSNDESSVNAANHTLGDTVTPAETNALFDALEATQVSGQTLNQIVFIDASVKDPFTLLSGIPSGTEVVFLDRNSDGLSQIALALQGRSDIGAIHILSHGSDGRLTLGNTEYNASNLSQYESQLAAVGQTLSAEGDILLYGCSLSAGVEGQRLIENLAVLTGADVAASDDATGAQSIGGDWQLEDHKGTIETGVLVSATAQEQWNHLLAPINNVPASVTLSEDGTVVFSTANGNAISVTNTDGDLQSITLTAKGGLLNIRLVTGLTFSVGDGTSDGSMTFSGTAANMNAALQGLRFVATANYNGAAEISIKSAAAQTTANGWTNGGFEVTAITPSFQIVDEVWLPGWQTDATDNKVEIWKNGNTGVPSFEGNQFVEINANQSAALFQTFTPTAGSKVTLQFAHRGRDGVDVMGLRATDLGADGLFGTADDVILFTETFSDGQAWGAYSREITASASGNIIRLGFRAISTSTGNVARGNFIDGVNILQGNSDVDIIPITILSVSDAPAGADRTVTINEDNSYTFSSADFPLTDTSDGPGNSLQSVIITTLPNTAQGVLRLNGVPVTAGDMIPVGSLGQLVFTPAANANGTGIGAFTFQVVDDGGTANGGQNTDQSPNTFRFNVTAVNDAPLVNVDTRVTNEDTPISGNVLSNDSDVEGSALTVTQFVVNGTTFTAGNTANIAGVGQLVINANGSYTFTPASNYNGAVPVVSYTASDGSATSVSTLTLSITAVNDAPVNTVPTGPLTVAEDTQGGLSVTGVQVTDVDGGTLTTTVTVTNGTATVTSGTGATVTGGGTATLTLVGTAAQINAALAGLNYRHTPDFNGAASLSIWTTDGTLSDTDSVNINITPVADIVNDTLTINEDASGTVVVLANDSFENSGRMITAINGIAISTGATVAVTNGTVTLNANGSVSFTPSANYNGNASFSYTVTSGGLTETATVTITIIPQDDAPINSVPTSVTTTEDGVVVFSTANGNAISVTDTDGTLQTITLSAQNGVLTLGAFAGLTFSAGDGTDDTSMTFSGTAASLNAALQGLRFTPSPDYHGPAQISMTSSNRQTPATSWVNGGFESPGGVSTYVLLNESLVPGWETDATDNLIELWRSGYNGVAAFEGNQFAEVNAFQNAAFFQNFTPTKGAPLTLQLAHRGRNGVDVLGVRATDLGADGLWNTADDVILFTALINDGQVWGAYNYDITPAATGNTIRLGFRAVSTSNGDPSSGNFIDGIKILEGKTDIDVIPITITPIQDIANDVAVTNEDTPITINVFANDSFENSGRTVTQINGTNIAINGTIAVNNGAVRLNADGTLTFSPAANYNGITDFTYTVSTSNNTETATVSVTVNPVNDAPIVNADIGSTNEDTPVSGNVLSNDSDVESNSLTVTQFVVNGNSFNAGDTANIAGVGQLFINANGSYTFTPAPNYNGTAPVVSYTVSDGNSTSVSTLTLTVAAINDAPVNTLPAGWTTNEDTTVGLTGLQIADVDAGSADIRVTLSVSSGALAASSGGGVTVTGSGSGTLILEGSLANLNSYLASTARPDYVPEANNNGTVTLTMRTNDLGNTGTGGSLRDNDSANITIVSVNDAPTSTDRTVTIYEDSPYAFSPAIFPISDTSDTPSSSLQSVIITTLPPAAQGVLSLNGVPVIAGDVISVGSLGQLVFSPATNVSGTDIGAFTFQVVDDGGTANGGQNTDPTPHTFSFNILAVNDAPVANADSTTTNEDTPVAIPISNLLGNDSDTENDSLTLISVQGAVNGTVSIVGGNVEFTPTPNFNGTASFTYTVSDGNDGTATATVTVTVTPVNDVPIARDDTASTPINQALSNIAVLANDSDADGNPLVVTNATVNPALGAVTINPDGTLNFTPVTNISGPVDITYTVSDGNGGSDIAVLTVNVGDNTPPDSADGTVNGTEDTLLVFTLADFPFSDADAGQSMADIRIDTLPANGMVLLNGIAVSAGQLIDVSDIAAGHLSFMPGTNANGVSYASFTFTVQDSAGTFDPTPNTLNVNISAVNDAPLTNADTGSTNEDTSVSGNVLSNDTDVEGNPLTVTQFVVDGNPFSAGDTANIAGVGQLLLNADGSYTFTPALNYNGTAPVVTYTVSDGSDTTTSNLTLSVAAVNDAPVNTLPVGWTTNEDTTVGLTGLQITDVDSGSGTIFLVLNVSSGTITANSGAGVTVTGSGTDTLAFEGTLADINSYLASAARPNYVPVANANGTVTLNMNTSDLGNTGTGGPRADIDSVNIMILSVNDAPSSLNRTVTINEDSPYTFSAANFPINDGNDTPGNSLQSVIITTLPSAAQGVLSLNGGPVTAGDIIPAGSLGQLVFTPVANVNGTGIGAFTFQIVDNGGTANGGQNTDLTPNTFSFNITAVNDAPVANVDTDTTNEDTPSTGNVLSNDTDVEGNTLTLTQFAVNGSTFNAGDTTNITGIGQLTLNADGSYIFTPVANYNGGVPVVSYTVSDGMATATSTLTLSVTAVNDAPLTNADIGSTNEDTSVSGNVLSNDTDVEGNPLTVTQFVVDGNPFSAGDTANIAGVGQLLLNADGSYTFTPALNYNGTAPVVTYTVSDGSDTTTSNLTLSVAAVNDAPVNTLPVGWTTNEDTTVGLTGLQITDVDSGTAGIRVTLSVATGTLTANSGNGVTVTGGGSGALVLEGSLADINAYLASAARPDYVPEADTNGTVTFTMSTNDLGNTGTGGALVDTKSATIAVLLVNDAPTGTDQIVTIGEDNTYSFSPADFPVDAGDTPPNDLDSVIITTLPSPATGVLSLNGVPVIAGDIVPVADLGKLLFTPTPDFNGNVSFTFQVVDNGGTANGGQDTDPTPNTFSFNVTAVDDAPSANPDTSVTNEDVPVSGNVLGNDSDIDSPTLTVTQFVIDGTPFTAGDTANISGVGQLRLNADGSYNFTPAPNYDGTVSIVTYTMSDGTTTSSSTLTLSITPVNDAPTATAPAVTTPENTTVTGAITTSDPEGDPLTYNVTATPQHGSVLINPDGSYAYTPNANYNGTDSFTVEIDDGNGGRTTVAVSVTVAPPQAPPDDMLNIGQQPNTAPWPHLPTMSETQVSPYEFSSLEVIPPIHDALNFIRPLGGMQSISVEEPLRAAVYGTRSLNGLAAIDVDSPVLSVVQNLEDRFKVVDSTTLFQNNIDDGVHESLNGRDVIVLSPDFVTGTATIEPFRNMGKALFSEQIKYQAFGREAQVDRLFSTLEEIRIPGTDAPVQQTSDQMPIPALEVKLQPVEAP